MVVLALLATVAASPEAAFVHHGGVCAGLSWVTVSAGERVFVERGPDFDVFRFHGQGGPTDRWWGLYSGRAAQVTGNGPILFKRDDVTVRRAIVDDKFRGYLAEKDGKQNHFFGSIFNGSSDDASFFGRVDFSENGQALCASGR